MTHYRQNLLIKAMAEWKRTYKISKAFKNLSNLALRSKINPAFQTIKRVTKIYIKSEQDFVKYREMYLK